MAQKSWRLNRRTFLMGSGLSLGRDIRRAVHPPDAPRAYPFGPGSDT